MSRTSDSDDELKYSPPGFAEALGRTIKVIRTDLGIERRELAKMAGISYSYLTEIENGNKPPSSSVLGPIATALGLRMFQLIEAAEARMESQSIETWPLEDLTLGLRADRAAEPAPQSAGPAASPEEALRSTAPVARGGAASPQSTAPLLARESPRRERFRSQAPGAFDQAYAMQPSLRGPNRNIRAAVIELERLLREMAPEDIERLLDFARRLAR